MARAYYLYLLIFLFAAGSSCKKSDPAPAAPDRIHVRYSHNETDGVLYGSNNTLMYFLYNDGKLSRRQGGLLAVPSTGQYRYIYSTDVYDTLVYNGNSVTITTHYNGSSVTPPPDPRYILLENGRISRVTKENDTAYYYYTNNISRIEVFRRGVKIIKNFTFDGKGNLRQVKSVTLSRTAPDTLQVREETFSQYDGRPNPLKSLVFLENIYYRTLSRNNYTHYAFTQRTGPPGTGSTSEGWVAYTLAYNNDGTADFTR